MSWRFGPSSPEARPGLAEALIGRVGNIFLKGCFGAPGRNRSSRPFKVEHYTFQHELLIYSYFSCDKGRPEHEAFSIIDH